MTSNNPFRPSLLTNTELEWVLGKKQLSKSFEYKIKSTLKQKIDKFLSFELPLLIQTQILDKELIQGILDSPINMLPTLVRKRSRDQIPLKAFHLSTIFIV